MKNNTHTIYDRIDNTDTSYIQNDNTEINED